ncbi:hypothetical protein GOBAR_AA08916 [Gossypium barbadense]|uniref:2-C-methyl-D-erythritol 2,4-cyclodiphosphate synthase n=1 Tax=Gossypium barbadense TaxID=3634 RepID=A0A2P5Y872_GOSBA|nr:hypothetical protein GOBAR_AA08916 [Gossypium barbadense]
MHLNLSDILGAGQKPSFHSSPMGSMLGNLPSFDPHNFSQLRPSDPSNPSFPLGAWGDLNPLPLGCKDYLYQASLNSLHNLEAAATSVGVDGPTASTNPSRSLPFRVGHGFGLHLLEPGYPLIIGGIDIPHSDGDVLLHCVVYAILGALGLPDIGQIVPNSDPKRKGAASSVFIKEAVGILVLDYNLSTMHQQSNLIELCCVGEQRSAYENAALEQTSAADSDFLANNAMHLEKPVSYTTSKVMLYPDINLCYMLSSRSSVVVFYEIGNLDANLILQRPKLSPHKEAIKSNLSQLLGADPSVVNLKIVKSSAFNLKRRW